LFHGNGVTVSYGVGWMREVRPNPTESDQNRREGKCRSLSIWPNQSDQSETGVFLAKVAGEAEGSGGVVEWWSGGVVEGGGWRVEGGGWRVEGGGWGGSRRIRVNRGDQSKIGVLLAAGAGEGETRGESWRVRVNQSDQSEFGAFLAEAADGEEARGGSRRIRVNQSDQSEFGAFLAEAAGGDEARGGSYERGDWRPESRGSPFSSTTTSTPARIAARSAAGRSPGRLGDQSKTGVFFAEVAVRTKVVNGWVHRFSNFSARRPDQSPSLKARTFRARRRLVGPRPDRRALKAMARP